MDVSIKSGTFIFSSRRRHTRLQGDWSSDVCSSDLPRAPRGPDLPCYLGHHPMALRVRVGRVHHGCRVVPVVGARSEEHTSELQSPCNLVCRLLLEKKKKKRRTKYETF